MRSSSVVLSGSRSAKQPPRKHSFFSTGYSAKNTRFCFSIPALELVLRWQEAASHPRLRWLTNDRHFLRLPNTRKDTLRKSHFLLLSRRAGWQDRQNAETVGD